MKIALMSDTHDNVHNIMAAMALIKAHAVDMIIHAGDFVAPFSLKKIFELKGDLPFIAVYGNNDGEKKGLSNIAGDTIKGLSYECIYEGKKIFVTHDIDLFDKDQLVQKYDVIISGHTHVALIEHVRDTVIINPGECCGIVTGNASIAILKLPSMSAEIIPF